MMYSNGFFQDRLRSNTSLNVIYAKDKGEPNPDDEQLSLIHISEPTRH